MTETQLATLQYEVKLLVGKAEAIGETRANAGLTVEMLLKGLDEISDTIMAKVRAALVEAVDTELDRLDGVLDILDLHEEDMQKLKVWVSNAKWALVAPPGKNTESQ